MNTKKGDIVPSKIFFHLSAAKVKIILLIDKYTHDFIVIKEEKQSFFFILKLSYLELLLKPGTGIDQTGGITSLCMRFNHAGYPLIKKIFNELNILLLLTLLHGFEISHHE